MPLLIGFVPLYIRRQVAAQAKVDREVADKSASDATNVLSWEGITHAIVQERDILSTKLTALEEKHLRELSAARAECAEEVARLKSQTAFDLDRAHERIKQMGDEINVLYRRVVQREENGS